MMKKLLLILCGLMVGCSTIKYVPVQTKEIIRDTVTVTETITVRDSCIIKDYIKLPDTLKMESKGAKAAAWVADSTIKGVLVDKPVKSTLKSIVEVRDSVIVKEVPVEVVKEVEVVKIPLFYRICGLIVVIELFYILWKLLMKIYIKK